MTKARSILEHTFGYSQFRGVQEQIVDAVIEGEDALVIMPTGGGKSLCYQIPALVRHGVAIVVSPLIALMENQVTALLELNIRAAFLNSTLSSERVQAIEQSMVASELDIVYVAPERLIQERTVNLLQHCRISLFAIDEAHCVAQWGHDFREDYLKLEILHQLFSDVPRIALTATADERTRQEIISRLSLNHAKQFISGFDRPNIQYRIHTKNRAKEQLLKFLEAEQEGNSGIVYCLSRNKVEQTAAWLVEQGFNALPYHAGLGNEIRSYHQRRFLREESVIIVATIAFGMGIDKPDVRFVAHLDMPKSVEAYYQETGRAGRDGEPATALLFYGFEDVVKLRQMAEQSQGSDEFRALEKQRLNAMLALCESARCRRQLLLQYFGETLEEPCGNCDCCLWPPETWNATEASQKALSCIYRTGQLFGAQHIVDVLRGENTAKVTQNGHNKVSTFGIGSDISAQQWRSILRQLTARGLIDIDPAYGSLLLSNSCKNVLRGEEQIFLRSDIKPEKITRGAKRSEIDLDDADIPLFNALKNKRRELAEEHGVPPYIIFHDATLKALASEKPTTKNAMLSISGIGGAKLDRYGDDFLGVLVEFEYSM